MGTVPPIALTIRGPSFGKSFTIMCPQNYTVSALMLQIQATTDYKKAIKLQILGEKIHPIGLDMTIQKCLELGQYFLMETEELPTNEASQGVKAEEELLQMKGRTFLTLSKSLYEMYVTGMFADLQIVISDPIDKSGDRVITAHRFILETFAPAFLHNLSSIQSIESGVEKIDLNYNVENQRKSPENIDENSSKMQRVCYNQFSHKVVGYFMEHIYAAVVRSFSEATSADMLEFNSLKLLFPSENTSYETRAILLETQINNPTYSDIAFVCEDGKKIYAHKAILSAQCEVFRAMFDPNVGLMESRMAEIAMPHSSAAFINILRFIYTASLEINTPEAIEVLLLSDQYCLRNLKYAAQVEIAKAISVENVCDFASIALRSNATYLLSACVNFMASGHLPEVVSSEGFQTLDAEIIEKIATRLMQSMNRDYDPSIFITEILSTIQQLKGTLHLIQCQKLLTDLCYRLGQSRENDELYTSSIRSDLLKDKFQSQRVPFQEIAHESYLTSFYAQNRIVHTYARNRHRFRGPSVTDSIAKSLNVDPDMVMKNLVFWWIPDRFVPGLKSFVTVLTCGNHQIDEIKLAKHLNVPPNYAPKKDDKNKMKAKEEEEEQKRKERELQGWKQDRKEGKGGKEKGGEEKGGEEKRRGFHGVMLANASSVFLVTGSSASHRRIPPFGFRKRIKTIIEATVMTKKEIFVPSGKDTTTWRMPPSSLLEMLHRLGIEHSVAPLI